MGKCPARKTLHHYRGELLSQGSPEIGAPIQRETERDYSELTDYIIEGKNLTRRFPSRKGIHLAEIKGVYQGEKKDDQHYRRWGGD